MALSEQEQRALREIEMSLLAEDPKFGTAMSGSGRVSLQGIAVMLLGLCLLIGGMALAEGSLWFLALSVCGFLVMFGAVVWMLKGKGSRSAAAPKQARPRASVRPGASGGTTWEDDFRRRFER